ncbi:hypothetical protein RQP46_007857 [Phenoliferia psychrophenolica]
MSAQNTISNIVVDQLAVVKAGILSIGTTWTGPTADVTHDLYEDIFARLGPTFSSTKVVRDVRYGPAERNVLDIYLPDVPKEGAPVVAYVHGGGFFGGDKQWSQHAYSNIGHCFASNGILAVIANYQLVPFVKYPRGGDDVGAVRSWIHENIARDEFGQGDPAKVVLIGQSSGAAHIATNLYASGDPTRHDSSTPLPRGVVYLSAPFFFDATKARRAETLRAYFGTDDPAAVFPYSGAGLLQNMPAGHPALDGTVLPTLVVVGQLDTEEIVDANVLFVNAYRKKSSPAGLLPLFRVLEGHNHISNVLSIGTEDQEQSQMLLDFVKTVTA